MSALKRGTKGAFCMQFRSIFRIGKWIELLTNQKVIADRLSDETFVKLRFYAKYGKRLNLQAPITYNEKVQWLKLYDRRAEYSMMVDKYEVKQYIARKIGNQYVIPMLGCWERFEDIDFASLPKQFVLKCTHDSGGLIVCRDKNQLDMESVRHRLEACLKRDYYRLTREWPYKNVRPRIIAEQYISESDINDSPEQGYSGDGVALSASVIQKKHGLIDYKFMCFDGCVKALFMDIGVIGAGNDHAEEYYRNVYDRSFHLLPFRESRSNYPVPILPPDTLSEMINVAETLSKGIPHVRVDLYTIDDRVYVGELTFYHGGGMTNYFDPPQWNKIMGDWIVLPK